MKLLRVIGPNFVAGAVLEKQDGKWVVTQCAPILKWMKNFPVRMLPERMRRKNLQWEWCDGR